MEPVGAVVLPAVPGAAPALGDCPLGSATSCSPPQLDCRAGAPGLPDIVVGVEWAWWLRTDPWSQAE